ncbi:uncharacterized mitochondrial protein AtMg00810-like [Solanum dulcamara]|uniref:uncharacterized mitochondrial protein AtMg00810-like n=1 Tax=Solanum dulcamara TaxID=45834 RepID=UPI00248501F3|nr:uncharacterized mitochondrial protein AtMg00810-like [Solanum dulcamara]
MDCGETFSSVIKPATIRTVLSLGLSKALSIYQLDIKNAFLDGEFKGTVYMYQPLGYRDPDRLNHVCLLKKSLYGLKQASQAWYKQFTDYFHTLGFSHINTDHSLFVYRQCTSMAYFLLYVDNIILIAFSDELCRSIILLLSSKFAMKDLGPLSYFLVIAITRHTGGLFLSRKKYVAEIIDQAGMSSHKPSLTPISPKPKLGATMSIPFVDPSLYQSHVGALLYLTFTRPDITFVVQHVCLSMHDPWDEHMNDLKRIVRYLQGTLDYRLHLYPSSTTTLISFTDVDWRGWPDTRHLTLGYCVFMGDNLISWSTKCQATLSLSSAEAEYRGLPMWFLSRVGCETCFWNFIPIPQATFINCDNVITIYQDGNPIQD